MTIKSVQNRPLIELNGLEEIYKIGFKYIYISFLNIFDKLCIKSVNRPKIAPKNKILPK